MRTVIDSLVVTLGLDNSNFTKGQTKTEEDLKKLREGGNAASKDLQAQGKKGAEFFTQIRNSALSLFAVLLGGKGIVTFASDATKNLADMGRQAHNMGMNVADLAAFRNAVEANGGSADAAAASFANLSQAMQQAKTFGPSPEMATFLGRIGASANDSPMAVYMDFVRWAQGRKPQEVLQFGQMGGLDQGSINEAMKGVDQVQKDLAAARARGVPSPGMTEDMQKLQNSWIALRQAADGLGNTMLDKAAPGMAKFLDYVTLFIEKDPVASQDIALLTAGLSGLLALRPLAAVMGWKALGGAIDSVLALLMRVSVLSLPLALSGDTGPDTATPEQKADLQRQEEADVWQDSPPQMFRNHIGMMHEGPMKRALQRTFGTNAIADTTMDPVQQGFLQTLSDPESGGSYDLKNGGSTFSDFSQFPEGIGAGGTSTASGRYQFTSDTWREQSAALGLTDFSPASQDKAAWNLASTEYRRKTGRDLEADLKAGGHQTDIAAALSGRWPSLPGGSQSTQSMDDFSGALARHTGVVPALDPSNATGAGSKVSQNSTSNTSTSEVNVNGPINIHTQATDAKGVATGIGSALGDYNFAAQANSGLA